MWNPFHKKGEEFPVEEPSPTPYPTPTPYPQPTYQYSSPPTPPQSAVTEKDLELISAKLDAIKALLESLNQRVANLERIARE